MLVVLWRQERVRSASVIGILFALLGVILISSDPLRQAPVIPVRAVVGGSVLRAGAAARPAVPTCATCSHETPWALTAGAPVLIAASIIAGDSLVLPQRRETWLAIGCIVAIGSIAVFLLYVVVLQYWTATRAAHGFVIIPLLTLLLSAWLDGEPVTWGLVLGGLLVLVGVYVGALRPGRLKDESPDHPA